jgi:hypothetical protein
VTPLVRVEILQLNGPVPMGRSCLACTTRSRSRCRSHCCSRLRTTSPACCPAPTRVGHLPERLAATPGVPGALIALGLLRRDDTRPPAADALAAVTAVVARSLRSDDWPGRSGLHEFAVLLGGTGQDAEAPAARLPTAISELGIPELGACAGVAALEEGATAAGTLRRAALVPADRALPRRRTRHPLHQHPLSRPASATARTSVSPARAAPTGAFVPQSGGLSVVPPCAGTAPRPP